MLTYARGVEAAVLRRMHMSLYKTRVDVSLYKTLHTRVALQDSRYRGACTCRELFVESCREVY